MNLDQASKTRCCGPEGCGDRMIKGSMEPGGRFCIADACMAWRWSEDGPTAMRRVPLYQQMTIHGTEDQRRQLKKDVHEVREGFCGLVGAPVWPQ